MRLSSKAFSHKGAIPKKHTGDAEDVSPELTILEAPTGTVSFALIMDDPDAPNGTFDHWIAWNLEGDKRSIEEGSKLKNEGINHFGETGYRGPLPPKGPAHRYFFTVYALKERLDLRNGATKEDLLEAMEGIILDKATLMGTYQR